MEDLPDWAVERLKMEEEMGEFAPTKTEGLVLFGQVAVAFALDGAVMMVLGSVFYLIGRALFG